MIFGKFRESSFLIFHNSFGRSFPDSLNLRSSRISIFIQKMALIKHVMDDNIP